MVELARAKNIALASHDDATVEHVQQAIASSSSQRPFATKTTHHQEWIQLFHCIVLGDDPDVKQGKPAPDIFLIAAQRLGHIQSNVWCLKILLQA